MQEQDPAPIRTTAASFHPAEEKHPDTVLREFLCSESLEQRRKQFLIAAVLSYPVELVLNGGGNFRKLIARARERPSLFGQSVEPLSREGAITHLALKRLQRDGWKIDLEAPERLIKRAGTPFYFEDPSLEVYRVLATPLFSRVCQRLDAQSELIEYRLLFRVDRVTNEGQLERTFAGVSLSGNPRRAEQEWSNEFTRAAQDFDRGMSIMLSLVLQHAPALAVRAQGDRTLQYDPGEIENFCKGYPDQAECLIAALRDRLSGFATAA